MTVSGASLGDSIISDIHMYVHIKIKPLCSVLRLRNQTIQLGYRLDPAKYLDIAIWFQISPSSRDLNENSIRPFSFG